MKGKVPTVSVDGFMTRHGLKEVSILHSDIQGHEVEMLRGAAQGLSRHQICHIFISTHGLGVHAQCLRILRKFDYRIIAEHTTDESYSVDGLIVATCDNSLPRDSDFSSLSWSQRKNERSIVSWHITCPYIRQDFLA